MLLANLHKFEMMRVGAKSLFYSQFWPIVIVLTGKSVKESYLIEWSLRNVSILTN